MLHRWCKKLISSDAFKNPCDSSPFCWDAMRDWAELRVDHRNATVDTLLNNGFRSKGAQAVFMSQYGQDWWLWHNHFAHFPSKSARQPVYLDIATVCPPRAS